MIGFGVSVPVSVASLFLSLSLARTAVHLLPAGLHSLSPLGDFNAMQRTNLPVAHVPGCKKKPTFAPSQFSE